MGVKRVDAVDATRWFDDYRPKGNIKDGVLDHFISLSLPEVMLERTPSSKMVLDHSFIYFTLG
jgi:hypothetical protein